LGLLPLDYHSEIAIHLPASHDSIGSCLLSLGQTVHVNMRTICHNLAIGKALMQPWDFRVEIDGSQRQINENERNSIGFGDTLDQLVHGPVNHT